MTSSLVNSMRPTNSNIYLNLLFPNVERRAFTVGGAGIMLHLLWLNIDFAYVKGGSPKVPKGTILFCFMICFKLLSDVCGFSPDTSLPPNSTTQLYKIFITKSYGHHHTWGSIFDWNWKAKWFAKLPMLSDTLPNFRQQNHLLQCVLLGVVLVLLWFPKVFFSVKLLVFPLHCCYLLVWQCNEK